MTGEPRKLPGRHAVCRVCRVEIRWAVTVASANGRGGRPMPLDAYENPDGNVAVRPALNGRLVARVLGKDETHDRVTELRAMPHFPTCEKSQADDLIGGVEQLLEQAATRTEGASQ